MPRQPFTPVTLYFFDQTDRVLVPDRIYLPRGEQLASTLVTGAAGRARRPSSPTPTPPSCRPAPLDLSVPVSATASPRCPCSDTRRALSRSRPSRVLVSQLAWTLRQVPVDPGSGSPRRPPGAAARRRTDFSVARRRAFAPYVAGANGRLFGLTGGRIVGGSPPSLLPVTGPFGRPTTACAVSPSTCGPNASPGSAATVPRSARLRHGRCDAVTPVITTARTCCARPGTSGRLWLVDRRARGRSCIPGRRPVRTLDMPGISGADVKDFLVSRDGSRLVAVLRSTDRRPVWWPHPDQRRRPGGPGAAGGA